MFSFFFFFFEVTLFEKNKNYSFHCKIIIELNFVFRLALFFKSILVFETILTQNLFTRYCWPLIVIGTWLRSVLRLNLVFLSVKNPKMLFAILDCSVKKSH